MPVVFEGSLDQVLEHFDAQLWTDGLPIVPPTVERVQRMLTGTTRDPLESFGLLPPEMRQATVWNVAVNGLMAGCRPADLPILVAVVEAITDRRFRLADAGSTTGWEPLVILSGASAGERGFNSGAGVMRFGRRANSSIGRFTRLFLRNVAGLRIPPGETDMCAIGQSTFPVMVEDDASVRELGWPSLREEWGFGDADLGVAVQGVVGTSVPIYSTGGSADTHLRALASAIGGCSSPVLGLAALFGSWSPLLALSPSVASVFAREGMTKDDVRQALAERARATREEVATGVVGLIGRELTSDELLRLGNEQMVRAIPDPAALAIVVTGEPGRNQSKYYVPVGIAGDRVVRRVAESSGHDGAVTSATDL